MPTSRSYNKYYLDFEFAVNLVIGVLVLVISKPNPHEDALEQLFRGPRRP